MFAFEDNIYEFTPKAIAIMDRSMAMIRDGASEEEVAESMGLPGDTPEQRLLQFRILRYYFEGESL